MRKIVVFDLDDTLYHELDYLKSGYKEISAFLEREYAIKGVWDFMMQMYSEGKNVFHEVNLRYKLSVPINEYLDIYRFHIPQIYLTKEIRHTLDFLKEKNIVMGIITDGRSRTQRNKLEALGLYNYFFEDNILISEEFGSAKPNERNYIYFEDKYPDSDYIYIGDNLEKDFITPNQRQWDTICLLDSGNNIHKQDFSKDISFLPKYKVSQLNELINSSCFL